ncbi:MFS transporter [Streptomyces sp. DSM 42041]|uniref:MFS transporter n=1 Tax=Streptomyces hazeniae TaxID=3075538 RepID=A0ABU2NYV5_9ACTN|nr:MFS transporter [Streptomyces sp. DSM 42041]MDT0382171.1 MFS transporter [Streptomyces sp. DSM 42041]
MRIPSSGQRLPRVVWLLIAARAVNRLGAFSLSFLTVLITTEFGASIAAAGLVSTSFGLATIPSRLLGGHLADRFGRRRTIVLGLAGCTVAQLGLAAAGNLPTAVCSAVFLGLVFELYEPPSQAIIGEVAGTAQRVRAYSLLNAALAVAGVGAGLLATGLGRWDLRWLFVADAITCLACAIVIHLVLPADRARFRGRASRSETVSVSPWRDRTLMMLLASGTVFALVYLQVMIVLPLSLADRGQSPADAGLLFTASALVIVCGQPLLRANPLAVMSAPAVLTAGYLLLGVGLAGYAAAHSLPSFLVATAVWSLGDLLLMGRMYAVVADLAPRGASARYMAAYGTSWGIASVAAPLAGTQLLEHAGTAVLWSVTAAACFVLAIAQPFALRNISGRSTRAESHADVHPAHGPSSPNTALPDPPSGPR